MVLRGAGKPKLLAVFPLPPPAVLSLYTPTPRVVLFRFVYFLALVPPLCPHHQPPRGPKSKRGRARRCAAAWIGMIAAPRRCLHLVQPVAPPLPLFPMPLSTLTLLFLSFPVPLVRCILLRPHWKARRDTKQRRGNRESTLRSRSHCPCDILPIRVERETALLRGCSLDLSVPPGKEIKLRSFFVCFRLLLFFVLLRGRMAGDASGAATR